jgi:hypothetical protein
MEVEDRRTPRTVKTHCSGLESSYIFEEDEPKD